MVIFLRIYFIAMIKATKARQLSLAKGAAVPANIPTNWRQNIIATLYWENLTEYLRRYLAGAEQLDIPLYFA